MIEELIDKLIDMDISIELVEPDKLKIHTDISRIPGELLSEIRLRKADLVRYLREPRAGDAFHSIPRVEPADSYPLSSAQRRLWLVTQLSEGNIAYHIPGAYVFDTEPDRGALAAALSQVVARHEILRTVFREDANGEPRQVVLPAQPFSLGFRDLRGEAHQEDKLKDFVAADNTTPFDLSEGPLLRATLYQVTGRWVFTYLMHHIISDGWSMGIMLKEVLTAYHAITSGNAYTLSPLRIQYKDFAAWQRKGMESEAAGGHRQYWLDRFSGDVPALQLPAEATRPAVKTFNGGVVRKAMSRALCAGLNALVQQHDSTLFMGLLAAVNALLYKYGGQEDIVIGTSLAGREHNDLHDQIGFYVNTLPLRAQFSGGDSFIGLLQNVRRISLEAYAHQAFPFDELVDALALKNDRSRNPLFDVMLMLQNNSSVLPEAASGTVFTNAYGSVERVIAKFDLTFEFFEAGGALHASIEYNSDIFNEATARRMCGHLEALLESAVANPSAPLDALNLLTAKDRELLHRFNDRKVDYPADKSLSALFDEQAARTPDAIATWFDGRSLGYGELQAQSNRLAHYLIDTCEVKKGEVVGLMMDRSDRFIIALLAVLKAGAAYVPIDPAYPAARKQFVLEDTALRVLVTQTDYMFDVDYFSGHLFAIDVQLDALEESAGAPHVEIRASDLAYIIYTSGSTGQPKGVMIEHGSIVNTIYAQCEAFDAQAGEHHLQFASISFDASVSEIFVALASGAALYIIGEEEKKNPALLENYINDKSISLATLPPAYLALLDIQKMRGLKKLVTAGEAAIRDRVVAFLDHGRYYNAYGPTEVSICATVFDVPAGGRIEREAVPIGKPIANAEVVVLDAGDGLSPIGVPGEICVGGPGLARGYLNDAARTKEKFIAHPFRAGARLYRTGDLGRWLPDGNIEFLGRKDDQVKIRGYRVELGEIENALRQQNGIRAAAVTAREAGAEKELVAYIVSDEAQNITDLRSRLAAILPEYMIPAQFVIMERMPLTTSGKIDRKKLPEPEGVQLDAGTPYEAPATTTEKSLAAIWEEVLHRTPIGVNDDYFELGGSSLKAMILVKKMVDELGRTLPVKLIFDEKNIRNIARRIDAMEDAPVEIREEAATAYEPGAVSPVSANQRIYFSAWHKDGGDHLVINSYDYAKIDLPAFNRAVNALIARHEILRTVFIGTGDEMSQQVLPAEAAPFTVEGPIPIASASEMEAIEQDEYNVRFDLSVFPLFTIKVYRSPATDTVLLTLHHIISDGYSGGILQEELAVLYTAILENKEPVLQPLPFQYRHFSAWQARFLQSAEGGQHRRYWLHKLQGLDHRFQLPSSTAFSKGNIIGRRTLVDGTLHGMVDRFAREQGLTRTVLFMGTLGLLVHELSGQEDVTVFTTASGRNSRYYGSMDVSGLIGFFVNLLFVRQAVKDDITVAEHLRRVQDGFLDDLSHDAYPSDELVRQLPGGNEVGFLRSTVFYNYHNYNYLTGSVSGTAADDREERRGGIPMNIALALGITEYSNAFNVQLMFNENLFGAEERRRIHLLYFELLQQVIANPTHSIRTIHKNLKPQQ